MDDSPGTAIVLVDNTLPPDSDARKLSTSTSAKDLSRISFRNILDRKRRRYAKWQPEKDKDKDKDTKSGVTTDVRRVESSNGESSFTSPTDLSSAAGDGSEGYGYGQVQVQEQENKGPKTDTADLVVSSAKQEQAKTSEIDILYENQRGWFLCGVPFYSHRSLLPIDLSAWVTPDHKHSPVNITNAQVPDPSWEWAWKTWYVDMSGDVDEQGWQYSFSFGSSAWHGSHPWFHSFVRRRRWVRLRVKRSAERNVRDRSGFEMAHMLNEDYFTIHSAGTRKRRVLSADHPISRVSSAELFDEDRDVDTDLDEIGNIPALMYALKGAIVDREKIECLKRFVEEGGEELYYLDERMPEIMSLFIFQNSRWQFLTYLTGVINELSGKASKAQGKEAEEIKRKLDNLSKAADTIRHNITGPDMLGDSNGTMLNLTPISAQACSSFRKVADECTGRRGTIKGIPEAAEIGREGHIY